jgi:hypothetical protein
VESFKKLLSETKGITPSSTWSKVRKDIEDDPRYKTKVLDSSDKQDIFEQYIAKLDEKRKK